MPSGSTFRGTTGDVSRRPKTSQDAVETSLPSRVSLTRMTFIAGTDTEIGGSTQVATPTGGGGRDVAARRALRHRQSPARARIHARNAKRERIDVLRNRRGGRLGVAEPARREARASDAVVRRGRSGSPNRGPPKTTKQPPNARSLRPLPLEGMHGTRNTVPSRAELVAERRVPLRSTRSSAKASR